MPKSGGKPDSYLAPQLTVAEFVVERGFFGSSVDEVSFDIIGTQSYTAASDGWESNAFSDDPEPAGPQNCF